MTDKIYNNIHFSPDYVRENPVIIRIRSLDKKFDDLTHYNLVRKSVKLKQTLCSEPYFLWGGFNSSQLTFECYSDTLKDNAPEGKIQLVITPTVYKDGVISERLDSEETALFTGYIETAEPTSLPQHWKITAYDRLYRVRNNNIVSYLAELLHIAKENNKPFTWREMIGSITSQLGILYLLDDRDAELPLTASTVLFPDNQDISCENGVDLLRNMALCLQRFGMIDGNGHLHFMQVQDSKTGAECYCIDTYDPNKLKYSVGHVWLPKFFTSEPRTNIFYVMGDTTTEEDYYNNYYTVKNSPVLGNQDWINEMYGCDEYGTPNPAYSAANMPVGLFDTSKMCLTNGEEFYQQEYNIKTYADPTIPMGSVLHIRKNGAIVVRSYIMQRTITFIARNAIQCEYSASNSPYNEAVSELDYGVRSANVLANETSAKMPFISDGSSLTKLRAHKVLSKSDYAALKEKRADTIYYVYDDSTS